MRASGDAGALRVGYHTAARLGAWTMALEARLPRTFKLRAAVLSEDGYWMSQKPLDVVLSISTVDWIWRDVEIQRELGDVEIRLSEMPIVEAHHVPIESARR